MSAILHLRIGEHLEVVDLAKCDNARLRQLAGQLYVETAQIKAHLELSGQARQDPRNSLDWEQRARAALLIKQEQVTAIEREQSRRQERAERSTTEHQFLRTAKERLPKALFDQLFNAAETAARKTRLHGGPRG